MPRERQGYPWNDGDVVMVSATAIVGLAAIVGAWFGAGGSPLAERQAAWLNLAIAGIAIFAAGNCLWLLRVRRAVGERRVSLVALAPAEPESPDVPAPRTRLDSPAGSARGLVRGAGMARVHQPDCPMVVGKPVEPAELGDGEPCGVCVS